MKDELQLQGSQSTRNVAANVGQLTKCYQIVCYQVVAYDRLRCVHGNFAESVDGHPIHHIDGYIRDSVSEITSGEANTDRF